MSLFNNIFGGRKEESETVNKWKRITSEDDLEAAVEQSESKKVVIFKHSTRCYISATVLRNFEKEMQDAADGVEFYFLDLLQHRNISNLIAERFSVAHQSPQIIVLKNGKAVTSASHHSISMNLV